MFSFHLRCRFFSLICTVFASIISSIWFLWWIFLPFSIFSSSTLSIVCIFQFLFHSCYATWLIQCRRHINNAHHFTSFLSLSHAMSRDSWKSINIVSDPRINIRQAFQRRKSNSNIFYLMLKLILNFRKMILCIPYKVAYTTRVYALNILYVYMVEKQIIK